TKRSGRQQLENLEPQKSQKLATGGYFIPSSIWSNALGAANASRTVLTLPSSSERYADKKPMRRERKQKSSKRRARLRRPLSRRPTSNMNWIRPIVKGVEYVLMSARSRVSR